MELDDKLLQYLNYKNGFYIECGANDGIFQSNTLKLEKQYNWKGLLIEASPSGYEKCLINRSKENIILNNALVSFDYPDEFEKNEFHSRFWKTEMIDGVVTFPRPGNCPYRKFIRPMQPQEIQTVGLDEEGLLEGFEEEIAL